jgi:hypothetical protein
MGGFMSDNNFSDEEWDMLIGESGIVELLETALYEVPPFTEMSTTDIENFGKRFHAAVTDIIEERMSDAGVKRVKIVNDDVPFEVSPEIIPVSPKKEFDVAAVAGRWNSYVKPKPVGQNGV